MTIPKSSTFGPVYLARTTCDRATRDVLLAAYPDAATDPVLWRALVCLLFTASRDSESELRLIGMDALEWIAGERIHYSTTRDDAFKTGAAVIDKIRGELLEDLAINEAEVELSDPTDGVTNRRGNPIQTVKSARKRTVAFDGIDPTVYRLVRADLMASVKDFEKRVRILDGTVFNAKAAHAEREQDREEAASRLELATSDTSRYILERMNDGDARPRNGYTKLLAYMDRAKAMATQLEVDRRSHESDAEHEARTHEARDGYLRLLRAIEDQPQPFYQPSVRGRTDRIFPLNPSVLLLPGPLRRTLTEGAGWIDLDLTSAHLAIAAFLWDVDSVRDFLGAGGNAWNELMSSLGLGGLTPADPAYDEVKDVLKTGTYCTVYGMTPPALKGRFTKAMKELDIALAGVDFASCWIVRDLLDARDQQYEQVYLAGEAETPTGIRAALGAHTGIEARNVLATVAQSYEATLMKPILEYEAKHLNAAACAGSPPDFRVMLWQHDGCSVRFWRRQKTHIAELQRRVRAVAKPSASLRASSTRRAWFTGGQNS